MTDIVVPNRRQERRGTAANLAAVNEVPRDGEWCIETDTGKTKLGDGVTAYNSLRYLDTNLFAAASGTNTITATFASNPVLYDGLALSVRAAAANTGAATFNPNGLGAIAITKQGGTALAAGDIAAAGHELILRYVASVPRWELLNPKASGSGGVSDGDKGDITVSGSGATWTIDNNAVTYAKMQDVSATARVIGRKTAGSGDPEELTLSEVLDLVGSAAQGDILYRGASAWARLAAGTSGKYLKTLGAGADPTWDTPSGGGGGAMTLIGTSTVAGSAATSLSVSGLDLGTAGLYLVEFSLKNATGSSANLSTIFNADSTTSNYDVQQGVFTSTAAGAFRGNLHVWGALPASDVVHGFLFIMNDFNSKPVAFVLAREGSSTAIAFRLSLVAWRTASNLTSYGFLSSVANSLAIGSYAKTWSIS